MSSRAGQVSAHQYFGALALLVAGGLLAWLRWSTRFSWLAAWLLAINVTTFLAYYYDKRGAGRGWLRVPEQLLHFLAIVGGSPAALLAQSLLRHKTAKGSFLTIFWIIFAVQAALVLYWLWGRV